MSNIKSALLGENFSTASGKLRKIILFNLVKKLNLDICYRCDCEISKIEDLSIEHKDSWQLADNPIEAFYSLENIAFSHLKCNVFAANKGKIATSIHGSRSKYKRGCKCKDCLKANSEFVANRRKITGKH